ncbi:MAG: SOS response-associated peptidase [Caldilineaceae bacterium]
MAKAEQLCYNGGMCGRFVLNATPEQLKALLDLPETPTVEPRYNIAPTQPVAIVRLDAKGQEREFVHTLWGLIPSWSKDPSVGGKMINARAETVAEKPSYRAAFKRRRCLVPATGFYEWQKQGTNKQPYFIHMADKLPFAIAGLWEQWMSPDGSELQTCTLLTTTANELMETLHDRMPVIVASEDYEQWLGTGKDATPRELDQLQHLLRPFDTKKMAAYPVDKAVGNTRNEGAGLIERLN